MKKETEELTEKIKDLIISLREAQNPTAQFYEKVISEINNCQSIQELTTTLDSRLIHAAGITDYGGYNREQCNLFDEMWKVAKSICTKNEFTQKMKTKLKKEENYLKGEWLFENGKVTGNEACERIECLINILEKIASTDGGWDTLYKDNSDGRYWELFYEHSERHGGGPPSLKNIPEKDAKEKYKL